MKAILPLCALAILSLEIGAAASFDECYKVEDIKLPEGVPPEVGAIDFAPDGTLFVVLRRGDVFRAKPTADPAAFAWQLFATGLHNGCGIDVLSSSKIRVTQMAEMTEIEDTDSDGSADLYSRFSSGWGLSGNYHETNALTRDGKGGYFLAVGTASHNGPVFKHTLGSYSDAGRRGRNFSSVKWKGWVLHADAEGNIEPFASGFRMHNGIYQDPDGRIWSGDNQGDWKATTPLYHIEKGNFYGHPSSLVWDPEFRKSKDPLAYYRDHLKDYNADRTPAAVEIPHMEMNRSAGEPMEIPRDGSFGPYAGQLLLPDNNGKRISRLMLEEVDGIWQGGVTHFINGHGLRSGNHRLRFLGNQLYIGQTVRGWGAPAEGLQRVTWLGKTPFDFEDIHITPTGFEISFTEGITEELADLSKWKFRSFTYQSKWTYGSPQEDKRNHRATLIRQRVMAGKESKSLIIELDDFDPGRIYSIELPKAKSAKGSAQQNRVLYYTANRIPKR